jgi:hypothetical protein
MTFSYRNHRERGSFEISAICIGGVVPVRARGRLFLETEPKSLNDTAREPAHSQPLPFSLPRVAQLVARLRLLQLLSRPFSSVVVIGNTLRRLASVLLLRLSQPPRPSSWLVKNWCGLPITRRSVFSRAQAGKQSARGLFDSFQSFLCFFALVHNKDSSEGTLKCAPKEFPKPEKDIPRTS